MANIRDEHQLACLLTWGYFSFSVFHNVANQVAQLQSLVDRVEKRLPDSPRRQLRATSDYLSMVVRDSQSVLHAEPGEIRRFSVPETLHQLRDLIAYHLSTRRIKLQIDCPRLLRIQSRPAILQQVLLNLLYNSMEAQQHSSPDQREITIRVIASDHAVSFAVLDNATAHTSLSEHARAFTEQQSGRGLGLAYVRYHCTQSLRGEFSLATTAEGTEATLTLPRSVPQEPARFAPVPLWQKRLE